MTFVTDDIILVIVVITKLIRIPILLHSDGSVVESDQEELIKSFKLGYSHIINETEIVNKTKLIELSNDTKPDKQVMFRVLRFDEDGHAKVETEWKKTIMMSAVEKDIKIKKWTLSDSNRGSRPNNTA